MIRRLAMFTGLMASAILVPAAQAKKVEQSDRVSVGSSVVDCAMVVRGEAEPGLRCGKLQEAPKQVRLCPLSADAACRSGAEVANVPVSGGALGATVTDFYF